MRFSPVLPFFAVSLGESQGKLTFQDPVGVLHFLFFAQLNRVFRFFGRTFGWTVLTGTVLLLLQSFVRPKNGLLKSAGNFGFGTCISGHGYVVWLEKG